jgi:hypothetical protein
MGREGLGVAGTIVTVHESPAGADNPLDAVGQSVNID